MKKRYMKPTVQMVETQIPSLLAGSLGPNSQSDPGLSGSGSGSRAFWDDDDDDFVAE